MPVLVATGGEDKPEPNDSEIKQAVILALEQLGFNQYDDYFVLDIMTTFFVFDATGRKIVVSVEGIN